MDRPALSQSGLSQNFSVFPQNFPRRDRQCDAGPENITSPGASRFLCWASGFHTLYRIINQSQSNFFFLGHDLIRFCYRFPMCRISQYFILWSDGYNSFQASSVLYSEQWKFSQSGLSHVIQMFTMRYLDIWPESSPKFACTPVASGLISL